MRAVVFNTKEQAELYSKQKAESMGCSGTTKFWWSIAHYKGKHIVMLGDDLPLSKEKVVEVELKQVGI